MNLHNSCRDNTVYVMQCQLLGEISLQHPAICEFPSRIFYEGRLKTDKSVERRYSGLHLNSFWPRGEEKPMVFCQVEGEENSGYLGPKGRTKVESQSKFNQKEAKKIVSKTQQMVYGHKFMATFFYLYTFLHESLICVN